MGVEEVAITFQNGLHVLDKKSLNMFYCIYSAVAESVITGLYL